MAGQGRGLSEGARWAIIGLVLVVGLGATAVARNHRYDQNEFLVLDTACTAEGNGGLVGFDAETGTVRWTRVTPFDPQISEVDGQLVLATTAKKEEREQVVDAADGHLGPCTDAPTSKPVATPALLDEPIEIDGLTVVTWGSGLRATDADGNGVWSTEHMRPQARLGDDLLVIGTGDDGTAPTLERVDLRTGETRWSVEGGLMRWPSDDGPLLVASMSDDGRITNVDPDDGSTIWSTFLPDEPLRYGFGNAYPAGDVIVFPLAEGSKVAVVDAATGELRWAGDGGSPAAEAHPYDRSGQPGSYLPGSITSAALAPDGSTVVVAVRAEDPVRDN